jgi:hypothetical protein
LPLFVVSKSAFSQGTGLTGQYYDTATFGTKADKVAAWFLDTDDDGRTFHVCQAFFPDKSAWEKIRQSAGPHRG